MQPLPRRPPLPTEIIIPGPPVPKGRPRMTRSGHVYTDAKTIAYERAGAQEAMVAGLVLRSGKVGYTLECTFYISARYWRTDLDNLVKICGDFLGLYGKPYGWHDGQIVAIRNTRKLLVPKGEERTVVVIREALGFEEE